MKLSKLAGTLAVMFLLLSVCAAQDSKKNSGANSFVIDSKILGEQNKAYVYLPYGYDSTDEKYPVIYVLDGEYNANFTAEAVKTLYQSERMPPAIVIGIVSNNRERDFTPAGDKNWQPPREVKAAGGADKFLNYLESELIPYVEKNYRTQPHRTIIGHSLGGLLALHSFTAKPNLFQAYIALESSLWWNEGATGKALMSYLTAHPDYKGKLFVSRIKMPREYWFPINVQFVDYFDKKHFAALEYKYTEIDDETHSTMVFPGTYFGLRDIFSDYRMEMNEKVTEQSILSYYNALFAKYGYPVKMPEQVINRLWVMMMEEKNYQKAMIYGESRIKTYPKSSRAYMDLGSTYVQTGNKEMATKLLTKSLEIDPNNDEAKQMLNSLTGK